jgi:hypothetical protein
MDKTTATNVSLGRAATLPRQRLARDRFSSYPDVPARCVGKHFGFGWSPNWGHPRARPFLLGMLLPPVLQSPPGLPSPGRLAEASRQMEEGIHR